MNVLAIIIDRRMWIHLLFAGIISIFISISAPKAKAADTEDNFAKGNRAYAEGKYDEALSYYKAVMDKEGFSASLFFNIANSYYQKRDLGQAILNYERGLYLDPDNPDIQANLRLAQKELGLNPEPVPAWKRLVGTLNLNQWTWMASMALAAFCFLILSKAIAPKILPHSLSRAIGGALLFLFVVSAMGVTIQYMSMDCGVITKHDAELLVSPFNSASSSAPIKEGEVVRIAKTYKDFVFVRGSARSGWIEKEAVVPLIPSGRPQQGGGGRTVALRSD